MKAVAQNLLDDRDQIQSITRPRINGIMPAWSGADCLLREVI